jgi:hypothetical protein
MVYIFEFRNHGSLPNFSANSFALFVDDFAGQRQIAISCLPDETKERFLHSGKIGCSVLLHFIVACSLADPFA